MEKWIAGFEGRYAVTPEGEVISYIKGTRKVLKSRIDTVGYLQVRLYLNGVRKVGVIHRLVAEAFIANPEGKRAVNHKNGNKLDNDVSNLEWVTYSENLIHAWENGLRSYNGKCDVPVLQIKDGIVVKRHKSLSEAGRELGIDRRCIGRVCNGKKKSTGGFEWKYATQ